MGDPYWNQRQGPEQQWAGSLKRPRNELDFATSGLSVAPEMQGYLTQNDGWDRPRSLEDTTSLGSAYDNYLRNSRLPSEEGSQYGRAGLGRAVNGDLPAFSIHGRDSITKELPEAFDLDLPHSGRGRSFRGPLDRVTSPREPLPLPPDASNTLYVDGLPSNCTKREVAHIFRPFVGYKEVRLVRKESKQRGDTLILGFVDFEDAACAATALSALQGYQIDEHDPDSPHLRLQFSKFPGPRSSHGPRGRR